MLIGIPLSALFFVAGAFVTSLLPLALVIFLFSVFFNIAVDRLVMFATAAIGVYRIGANRHGHVAVLVDDSTALPVWVRGTARSHERRRS